MKFAKLLFSFIFFYFTNQIYAQNYVINPSTDGGFEGDHGWTIVNAPTAENQWFIGNAEKTTGSNGAYVSSNIDAQSIASPQSLNAVAYLYKDVVIPSNATAISLSFKFKNPHSNNQTPKGVFFKNIRISNNSSNQCGL